MSKSNNFFQNLFVFDLANNHMGDVNHGLRIINELHKATSEFDFPCALKFQFRDLDSFIHPSFKTNYEFKYVKRFQETRLTDDEFSTLKQEADKLGFISMFTPFDENSVNKIVRFGFNIIKIASCSLTDWPLLEKIAKTNLPIIASTAGASLDDIDKVILFFEHRRKKFAIMHCVGEYPTSADHLNLNQIDLFRNRYPNAIIGYSTHEDPENYDAIKIAIAKGAKVFERHVGISTKKYSLNLYSSTPDQIKKWMISALEAVKMSGVSNFRREIYENERKDLQGLMRGVFAKYDIHEGEKITLGQLFYAIPNFENQLVANHMSKYSEFISKKNIKANSPIFFSDVEIRDLHELVSGNVNKVLNMLIDSKIHVPHDLNFELSHHYGLENFKETGATIVNCINREYCKKIVILIPGQKHPVHYHKKKEETFQVLSGELYLSLNGIERIYNPGEIIVVERGVKHSFSSEKGTIFEEISTTHCAGDSYYDDPNIEKNKNRKTEMTFWADWLDKMPR